MVKSYNTYEVLKFAAECTKIFGYHKTSEEKSTAEMVEGLINLRQNNLPKYKEVATIKNFHPEANASYVTHIAVWAKDNLKGEYGEKLNKILTKNNCRKSDVGILVSLPQTYENYCKNEEYADSEYVGEPKQKIEIEVRDFDIVYRGEGVYGPFVIFRFIDVDKNVFVWSTSSRSFPTDKPVPFNLRGTVKEHKEYRGIKQTALVRCKIV